MVQRLTYTITSIGFEAEIHIIANSNLGTDSNQLINVVFEGVFNQQSKKFKHIVLVYSASM